MPDRATGQVLPSTCHTYIEIALSSSADCGTLPAPDNGDVDFAGTIVGSQVVYSCQDGFMLEGAKIRTCLESGKWSKEEPICKGKIMEMLSQIVT